MFKKKSLNIEKKLLELEHGQYSDTSKQSIVLKTEIILYISVFHLFVFLPDTVYWCYKYYMCKVPLRFKIFIIDMIKYTTIMNINDISWRNISYKEIEDNEYTFNWNKMTII